MIQKQPEKASSHLYKKLTKAATSEMSCIVKFAVDTITGCKAGIRSLDKQTISMGKAAVIEMFSEIHPVSLLVTGMYKQHMTSDPDLTK